MPLKKHMIRIEVSLTPEEYEVVKKLIFGSKAEFLRECVADRVKKEGLEWPDNHTRWGSWKRD